MEDPAQASPSVAPAQPGVTVPGARRRRIREVDTIVAEVVRETADTVTLVFAMREPADYAAGQFLTIDPHQFDDLADLIAYFQTVKGRREPPRAYSMSSSPLEPRVAVTVKEERYVRGVTRYPPLLSPYLVRQVNPGQRLRVVGFTGAYVLPPEPEERADHIVHVVAGSGAVPNFAILKYALSIHPGLRHTFVDSNKTWDDIIFREGLAALEQRFSPRLRLVHTLTREEHPQRFGAAVRQGRVGPELLREVIPDPGSCLVYACGPANGPFERAAARRRGEAPGPRFLETVVAALNAIGVPRERVKTEAYG